MNLLGSCDWLMFKEDETTIPTVPLSSIFAFPATFLYRDLLLDKKKNPVNDAKGYGSGSTE